MDPHHPSGKSSKEKNDLVIGRALSRAVSRVAPSGDCPSLEEISAFVDQKLSDTEKEAITGHISHCQKCYQTFLMAHEMVKPPKRKVWPYVSVAVAIAAILLIVVKISVRTPVEQRTHIAKGIETTKETPPADERTGTVPKPDQETKMARGYTPWPSREIAQILVKSSDPKTLSTFIEEEPAPVYGFSGTASPVKLSFKIGVRLVDLEVSLRADDREKSLNVISALLPLLKSFAGSENLVTSYENLSKMLRENAAIEQSSVEPQGVEALAENKGSLLYLRFGEWVEGGRIAAAARNRDFFNTEAVEYFVRGLEGKDLPKGVLTALGDIKTSLAKDPLEDRDFARIGKAFQGILDMI